ncbi:MAG: hypothetical protein LKG79_03725 [Furfurilactobacillus sp.]|jgi:hypothetical protein|uniref:Bacteriocin n=1 Tax=Furfurilactobacillus milii TaxID=2888272 RepID=A0ABT6D913_9LACO|nr:MULTISPECIES: hypothetical protein [Furfurilactobacillus]QLE67217.1 hypothetical protein LROSL2_1867 [Furfurilactobacillus rossiae]MCF6161087.1 hypothetical protein [Furfurilactobacillus milii]MCF6163423.1 hypothetical protein [Furfurilactobacillus milii]MCF6418775.1 hypothetical protein [Furfurilactobacillus milii]MCH4011412.1 hypothetical protein [Furfurilactobacillus sp.]
MIEQALNYDLTKKFKVINQEQQEEIKGGVNFTIPRGPLEGTGSYGPGEPLKDVNDNPGWWW